MLVKFLGYYFCLSSYGFLEEGSLFFYVRKLILAVLLSNYKRSLEEASKLAADHLDKADITAKWIKKRLSKNRRVSRLISYDFLYSQCYFYLLEAAIRWDSSRSTSFSTYAISCMRKALIREVDREIKSADHLRESNDLIFKLYSSDGRRVCHNYSIVSEFEYEVLYKAMNFLSKRDQHLLTYYYGLKEVSSKNATILAKELGISHQRVSDLIAKAVQKLMDLLE